MPRGIPNKPKEEPPVEVQADAGSALYKDRSEKARGGTGSEGKVNFATVTQAALESVMQAAKE